MLSVASCSIAFKLPRRNAGTRELGDMGIGERAHSLVPNSLVHPARNQSVANLPAGESHTEVADSGQGVFGGYLGYLGVRSRHSTFCSQMSNVEI